MYVYYHVCLLPDSWVEDDVWCKRQTNALNMFRMYTSRLFLSRQCPCPHIEYLTENVTLRSISILMLKTSIHHQKTKLESLELFCSPMTTEAVDYWCKRRSLYLTILTFLSTVGLYSTFQFSPHTTEKKKSRYMIKSHSCKLINLSGIILQLHFFFQD